MSSRIDRNDVDISKLFYYKDKFEIKTANNQTLTVYMRVIGDAELNRAKVFALRESRKLREKLKDPESDEALAYLPDIYNLSKEELVQNLLSVLSQVIAKEAVMEYKFTIPPEPKSTASLEEQEDYQEEVDKFDDDYENELSKLIQEKLKKEEERLNSLSEEVLRTQLEKELINQVCEYHMVERFRAMCAFFGTYKDENYKQRLFSTFEEFDNLPKDVKEEFISFYNKLELSEQELKKSPVPLQ